MKTMPMTRFLVVPALAVALCGCEPDKPPVSSWPLGNTGAEVPSIPPIPADELPALPPDGIPPAGDTANLQALMMRFGELATAADALADNALQCEGQSAYPDRARSALAYAWAALAVRNDLQRVAVLSLGAPLETDATGFTQSRVRRIMDSVRHVSGCPDKSDAQLRPHVGAYYRSLAARLRVQLDRALTATDPAVPLRTFDDLSREAELLMQAASMDLDMGWPTLAAELATEIYALGLTALQVSIRWREISSHQANDSAGSEILTFAEQFRANLEKLAARPGMPPLSESAAWQDYERARKAAGD